MPMISYRAFCSDCDQIANVSKMTEALRIAKDHETKNAEHRVDIERCEVVREGN